MCLMSCREWEAELINSGKSRQAAEDSSRLARAGPPGPRLAHKARLLAFCAHFSYLCSQASKYESHGMKINLELKGGRRDFILSGFPGLPCTGTARRDSQGGGAATAPSSIPPTPGSLELVRGGGGVPGMELAEREAVSPCSSSA